MLDLELIGTVVAVSDISISPPDHSEKEGPATVATLPEKAVWRDGQLLTTIYIPASSIRGALRNGAARALVEARAARGKRMTPEDFLLVAKGGIKDRKQDGVDERTVDYNAAAELRRSEPLVSLFGAMAEKIAGRWQIGDAVPTEPVKSNRKGRGVRSHPFQRQPELARFMDADAYREFLESDGQRVEANLAEDEAEKLDGRVRAEKRRPEPDPARIDEWEAKSTRLKEEARRLRGEAGGAVNIQQVLGGWRAIPEGTRMAHRMRLRDIDDTELAWAFLALRRLAREGRLGAHESRGEGYFSAEYDLRLAQDGGDFAPAGKLCIADLAIRLEGDAPEALAAAFARSATILDEAAGGPA